MKAVRIHQFGGPEVLKLEEIDIPKPQAGEVLVKVEAAGVNYSDLSRRKGDYPNPLPFPFIAGSEVAGTVAEVGEAVSDLSVGTRVAALAIGFGGYCEYITLPATLLTPIPAGLAAVDAAAIPMQAMTASGVLRKGGRLQPGETVLVHAAAGGVGTLSVQLAKIYGAGKVIATASTPAKLELARSLGADVLINYSEANWPEQVLAATDGKGADVILEMVGGQVFEDNFKCLAEFGRVVVFGSASDKDGVVDPHRLSRKCQAVSGFWVGAISNKPELARPLMAELLDLVQSGKLKLQVNHVLPLAEAAKAQEMLAARKTTGKIVLVP